MSLFLGLYFTGEGAETRNSATEKFRFGTESQDSFYLFYSLVLRFSDVQSNRPEWMERGNVETLLADIIAFSIRKNIPASARRRLDEMRYAVEDILEVQDVSGEIHDRLRQNFTFAVQEKISTKSCNFTA